jgi:hypothetical protein
VDGLHVETLARPTVAVGAVATCGKRRS